jgi:hypothetical protein
LCSYHKSQHIKCVIHIESTPMCELKTTLKKETNFKAHIEVSTKISRSWHTTVE